LADHDLSGDQSAQVHDGSAGAKSAGGQNVDSSVQQPAGSPPKSVEVLDLTAGPNREDVPASALKVLTFRDFKEAGTKPYSQAETQENTRGDLARGLLWLLTFAIGGVLVFIGLGRLDGTVLTQSIFPSLVALAGTALGFYFGSQTAKESGPSPGVGANGADASTGSAPSGDTGGAGQQKTGG
jgi:hypothetical protein